MDIKYLLFLQMFRELSSGCFNAFFVFISTTAVNCYVMVPALIIFWVVDKKKGMTVLGSLGLAVFLNSVLKTTFCVYRPWILNDKVHPFKEALHGAAGYSFPSGHAAQAGGFYGGLISAYRKYKPLCVLFAIMILLTMFSRNFLGVHTPQDVIVGACCGLIAAVIMTKVLNAADRIKNLDIWIFAGSALLSLLALAYIYFKPYPMDYVNGVLLVDPKKMAADSILSPGAFLGIITGWFIERRLVRFEIPGTADKKVFCALLGALLFMFYYTSVISFVGKQLDIALVNFLLQISGPVLFMTVYPLIFTTLQKKQGK